MITIESKEHLHHQVSILKSEGKTIGFVPTMGALHKGHLSLIEASNKACDITISSIFVNPNQFNDKDDYQQYPRTFETDKALLEQANCDILFAPSQEEMYPEKDSREFDFGELGNVMEGAHRPGHFNGVAQIVSKLFDAVPAHKAFFGQKDFQQYVIIKDLVKQLNYNIEIIACPIVREKNGLAMSSRNQRLSEKEKEIASNIFKILSWAKKNYLDYSVSDLKDIVAKKYKELEHTRLEYFDIVNDTNLQTIKTWEEDGNFVACVAIFCGKVRLIDNIVFNLQ